MTNRERLSKMNNLELALKLCEMQERCGFCCVAKLCNWGKNKNGWQEWLEAEAEEDDE